MSLASVGLDESALDRTADPCADFYQFACGSWLKKTEIPSDKARWARSFNEIHQRNEAFLHDTLESARSGSQGSPVLDKIGRYYGACMSEDVIERAGLKPVRALLAKARAIRDAKAILPLLVELHRAGIWALFDISAEQDFKDATRYLAYLDQNGLGLPDRDYYFNEDAKSKEIRAQYRTHVAKMLELGGLAKAEAERASTQVFELETALAKSSQTKVERRDPKTLYNKFDRAGLDELVTRIDWKAYFDGLGHGGIADLNVTNPKFFGELDELIKTIKPDQWRAYFQWHILRGTAAALPKAFVDESFRMEQVLTGQKEQRVRWKRCVQATDEALGELLAQPFVKERFAGASKSAALGMVHEISTAFGGELKKLAWMDARTRGNAEEKLQRMAFLIGYPDTWRAYDFEITRDGYAANLMAARGFELQRQLKKIGKPVDRSEWDVSPPTVNAYYTPLKNQMVFPAGILQPPMYSVSASIPVNLGAMGMVVGHELTHGFDDEGSQFDASGNLLDWWSSDVKGAFEQRTGCIEKQYAAYEALPGVHLNGKLTLGENIADVGGEKLAFMAYRRLRSGANEELVADGFSEDQQFFLATGQIWCSKYREEYARMAAQVDPHSPPRFRVNGVLANLPQFAEAFACKSGSAMAPKTSCSVW